MNELKAAPCFSRWYQSISRIVPPSDPFGEPGVLSPLPPLAPGPPPLPLPGPMPVPSGPPIPPPFPFPCENGPGAPFGSPGCGSGGRLSGGPTNVVSIGRLALSIGDGLGPTICGDGNIGGGCPNEVGRGS